MSGDVFVLTPESPEMTIDLLNALASVRSLSEILRDHPGIDGRQKRRFINIILTETQRMAEMMDAFPLRPISA